MPEIPAENQFNIGVGIAAADQAVGQIEHALVIVEAIGVRFAAKSLA